ncbi:hypothetical protein [Aquimarina rubra]|uniref:STAS/SEC14 domain-containing protein n=1 Tax=Aquimarina rubra TaxID=1920033 RepID=A0ABW5LMH7_9FLAO
MPPDITRKLVRKHILDIGSFYFYDHFLISEMNEGVTVDYDKATKLLLLIKDYYGNNIPFVYITNRVNSYSFEPTAHFKSAKLFPNLKGYGAIIYDSINNKIASLEQSFLNVPTKIFDNVEDAVQWVNELILHD